MSLRYRCDVLGPSADGMESRWIYGTTTAREEAERQYDLATEARLVSVEATVASPIERDVKIKRGS